MANGMGLVLLLFGLPNAVWPYKMARFEERWHSIGSKRRWSEVEPADWKVAFTRAAGVGMILFGIVVLIGG